MQEELDVIVLARDMTKYHLKKGDVGTVVHVYDDKRAVEVEFLTAEGKTVAVLTLKNSDVRQVAKDEIMHVREFASFAQHLKFKLNLILDMAWCFALVNGRLAKIYFNETKNGPNFVGHCYVQRSEYTTKREQKWIDKNIVKHRFSYRNKKYRGYYDNKIFKLDTCL